MILKNAPRLLATTFAVATIAVIVGVAHACIYQYETNKLLPSDGAAWDFFGRSVAISGTTAIVGAYRDDDNGTDSGAAYLFDLTTGHQLSKLLPNDGAAGDHFGLYVAISGSIAIVGASSNDAIGVDSGAAYLFDAATGQQLAKLLPNDGWPEDYFGGSVDISESIAIVGATGDDDNGMNSGSAYLFNVETGQEIAKLLPNDGSHYDHFGSSVAISGLTAVVGSPHDDDNGNNSGSAYVFDVVTGQQIAKLLPNDGEQSEVFGTSVAISGNTGIFGVDSDDENGAYSGAAYLFNVVTGQQLAKLLADDGEADDRFGWSVAISGDTALIGAALDDDSGYQSGSAYLFDVASGQQITKLLASAGMAWDGFARSVAIAGSHALVGMEKDDENGTSSGSVYTFNVPSSDFCYGDFDCNFDIGTSDLLELLLHWGSCNGCAADLDGSGLVDVLDLFVLLAFWGPCP